MDLRDYLRAVRKRWWMVLGAVAVAVGLAVLITVRTPPQYATSVTFFVTTPNTGVSDAYQGGLFSQQRVKSYVNLLTSDRLAQTISGDPAIELTAAQIRGRISASAVPDTVLLQAVVTDGSKARSTRIAEVLARHFKILVESLETPPGRADTAVKVEVVAGPELNDSPVSPRPVRNVGLALLLGLVVGAGAAVLRELFDTTVRSAESLQLLAGAPVLAGVPYDTTAKTDPLLVGSSARSPRAEALRQLRTNLQFVDVDRPVKTLVVTSAVPEEGKSSTACNLAVLFAETGQQVLLIDADLRRPRLADYFGLEGAVGLTTILAGRAKTEDVLQRWGTGLWVLPSGFLPPNPSELLGSQHMSELLDGFRETFDMVILDCPPLLPVTDGAVAAARADGALLLVRSGKTTSTQVTAAANALRSVDARLLGCVVNMVRSDHSDPYHYYDYGYGPTKGRHGRHDGDGPSVEASIADLLGTGDGDPAVDADAGPVRSAR